MIQEELTYSMCYCGTCRPEYVHSKAIPQMTQVQMCCFVSLNMMKSHQSVIRACHVICISQVRHRAKQCRQTANEAGMTRNYGSSLSFLILASIHLLCLWHSSIQLLVITPFYRILSAKSALRVDKSWKGLDKVDLFRMCPLLSFISNYVWQRLSKWESSGASKWFSVEAQWMEVTHYLSIGHHIDDPKCVWFG